jgi:hypothetical protein
VLCGSFRCEVSVGIGRLTGCHHLSFGVVQGGDVPGFLTAAYLGGFSRPVGLFACWLLRLAVVTHRCSALVAMRHGLYDKEGATSSETAHSRVLCVLGVLAFRTQCRSWHAWMLTCGLETGLVGHRGGSITAVMLSDRPGHLVGEQRRHSKAHRVRGLHKGLLP